MILGAAWSSQFGYIKVRYRGYWYYVSDMDLSSKTTFSLLTYLYSLKAGSHDLKEPVLTLGIQ